MKAAIMCHANDRWTEVLPLVLLGKRTAYKADLQASTAELVYGEPLRVPGELLVAVPQHFDTSSYIQQLRHHMSQLRPTPASRHASPGSFIHKDLPESTHVFLRKDGAQRSLQPPYSGPHQVISRMDKSMTIVVSGRHTTISTDTVKPAYLLMDTHPGSSCPRIQPSSPPSTSDEPPRIQPSSHPSTSDDPTPDHRKTTCSGRTVHYPARFLT